MQDLAALQSKADFRLIREHAHTGGARTHARSQSEAAPGARAHRRTPALNHVARQPLPVLKPATLPALPTLTPLPPAPHASLDIKRVLRVDTLGHSKTELVFPLQRPRHTPQAASSSSTGAWAPLPPPAPALG